jgi:hypothetical protein
MMDMDTVQIEITNACNHKCGNCTRFCQLVQRPFFMPLDEVKRAIDSMVGYPKMTGIMGGEPLLHPDFEEICRYAGSKINANQLGLWTTLPKGFEKYNKVICETFYHIFVNDHTRPDIYHHPSLVGIQEVCADKNNMWQWINNCWAQMSWSASINPRGAWFCEIAASMAMLYDEGEGWSVEPGWWWKIPKDFREQMEQWCPRCGMAAPLALRSSLDEVDDVSPLNYEALKGVVRNVDRLKIHPLTCVKDNPPMAAYKELNYRNRIADRYGMFLVVNEMGFWTPYLKKGNEPARPQKSILDSLKERFGSCAT